MSSTVPRAFRDDAETTGRASNGLSNAREKTNQSEDASTWSESNNIGLNLRNEIMNNMNNYSGLLFSNSSVIDKNLDKLGHWSSDIIRKLVFQPSKGPSSDEVLLQLDSEMKSKIASNLVQSHLAVLSCQATSASRKRKLIALERLKENNKLQRCLLDLPIKMAEHAASSESIEFISNGSASSKGRYANPQFG